MVMVTLSPSVTDEALAEILPPPFALTATENVFFSGPLLSVSATRPSFFSFDPAAGVWPSTVPSGWSLAS